MGIGIVKWMGPEKNRETRRHLCEKAENSDAFIGTYFERKEDKEKLIHNAVQYLATF